MFFSEHMSVASAKPDLYYFFFIINFTLPLQSRLKEFCILLGSSRNNIEIAVDNSNNNILFLGELIAADDF